MNNRALEAYLRLIDDQITVHAQINLWISDKTPTVQSLPARIIESIKALERGGYNVPGKDWVGAVQSTRFHDGRETVARILAYPDEPGKDTQPMRLARMLGLDEKEVVRKYHLSCGCTVGGVVEEETAHAIWHEAAHIATEMRARVHVAGLRRAI